MQFSRPLPNFVAVILKYFLKYSIQNIATIYSGIYATTGLSGEVVYLQANHFSEHGQLASTLIPNLYLNQQTQKHLLRDGDILFAAKGHKNFATVYEEKNGLCVASSTFLVVRINEDFKDNLLPEFLAWYINNPATQKWLKANAIGSALPSISKSKLLELEIQVPELAKQDAILKIYALRLQEREIQVQLIDKKEQYLQQLLLKALE